MTKQRELIYAIIQNSDRHLSADEVYTQAKRQMPGIVRATVYNSLNYLTENGMIRRIRIYGDSDRYDHVLTMHEHLICDRCGELSDITLGDLQQTLSNKTGIEITGYELNLHYICPACRARDLGVTSMEKPTAESGRAHKEDKGNGRKQKTDK